MPNGRRRGHRMPVALSALWSARTWRATLHALAGLPAAVATGAVLGVVVVIWAAAVLSLIDGPTGGPALAVSYAVIAVVGLLPLPWCVQALGALQRSRFRAALGIQIAAPPRQAARGSWRSWPLVRSWRAAATWRQLGYHVLAMFVGTAGAALVAGCWAAAAVAAAYAVAGFAITALIVTALVPALLLAAPWVARVVARVDETAARRLLGPSRAEMLAERVESLARSRADVVAATDAERRRIERDLHDGAQQRLISLAMNLGMARANLTDMPESARQAIEQAHDEATQAVAELRELVRGLHPAILNDRGLDAALSGIVARMPLPVRLRVDIARRCSPSIEAIAYFVVSEALTNIAKHADAGQADVTVERVGDRLRVVVADDGRGGATPSTGSGLLGLAQRTAAVDGTLNVHSPPGGPTIITVELPCES